MSRLKTSILPIALLVGLLSPIVILACIWDYDTLKMERSRFPSTIELITGKFLRHTPEFYQWRINDRLKRLEKDPNNVTLLDDLAVAYDKTGQHDKAIETAQNTEKIKPGRYETAANLGTFYFHSGKFEEGLPHIDKALKINPDAHFGREYYQKALVEYLLIRRKNDPLKLPLSDSNNSEHHDNDSNNSFDTYLWEIQSIKTDQFSGKKIHVLKNRSKDEILKDIKGIQGMMRFGSHTSPILLEALGSLLATNYSGDLLSDAKLLACRAYLKASYEAPEGPASSQYKKMAKNVVVFQWKSDDLSKVEALFKQELEEAQTWYNQLREKELSWIREGKNPEVEFDKLYDSDPELSGGETFYDKNMVSIYIFGVSLLIIITIVLLNKYKKRINKKILDAKSFQ